MSAWCLHHAFAWPPAFAPLQGLDDSEVKHVRHQMPAHGRECYRHLLVQIEALPLALHVGLVQVVAAHLILVLHEQLPICHVLGVLDVFEVRNPLQIKHASECTCAMPA